MKWENDESWKLPYSEYVHYVSEEEAVDRYQIEDEYQIGNDYEEIHCPNIPDPPSDDSEYWREFEEEWESNGYYDDKGEYHRYEKEGQDRR